MDRKHEKYEQLIAWCKGMTPIPTAAAHPYDESSLKGAVLCQQLGVSGVSSDMRTPLASDSPRAKFAVELFVYRIGRELGRGGQPDPRVGYLYQ